MAYKTHVHFISLLIKQANKVLNYCTLVPMWGVISDPFSLCSLRMKPHLSSRTLGTSLKIFASS